MGSPSSLTVYSGAAELPESVVTLEIAYLVCRQGNSGRTFRFWGYLKLMIGVIFSFLDCHKFQNVRRKLEYSDSYLAKAVRKTKTTLLLMALGYV